MKKKLRFDMEHNQLDIFDVNAIDVSPRDLVYVGKPGAEFCFCLDCCHGEDGYSICRWNHDQWPKKIPNPRRDTVLPIWVCYFALPGEVFCLTGHTLESAVRFL